MPSSEYEQLTQQQRVAAVTMHHVGRSHAEIASILGCHPATSLHHYQQAIAASANSGDGCDIVTLVNCDYLKPGPEDYHRDEQRGRKLGSKVEARNDRDPARVPAIRPQPQDFLSADSTRKIKASRTTETALGQTDKDRGGGPEDGV